MRTRPWSLGLLLTGLACWCGVEAAQEKKAPELPPHKFDLPADEPLDKLLAHVRTATKLPVEDRRRDKAKIIVKGGLKGADFWPAMDAIAQQANLRLHLYQPDGVVALVEGPHRPVPVSYSGPFRTALKQVTLDENLETGHRTCVLVAEVAWEPGLYPFIVTAGPGEAKFSPDAKKASLKDEIRAGEQFLVAGRPPEIPLRLAAPERSAAQLESLRGYFTVTLATELLTFRFNNLKAKGPAQKAEQNGVRVRVEDIRTDLDNGKRWTVDVFIDNPPDGPKFASHQLTAAFSWLNYNTLALEKKTPGGGMVRLRPADEDFELDPKLTSTRAHLRYHFTQKANPGIAFGKLSDWELVCRTPGRMVEVKVPYRFEKVRLP